MIIQAHIITNAKANQIIPLSETDFKIKITAKPHQGRANQAIIKLLSQWFKIPKTKILLISGEKSRHKVFQLLS